VSTHAWHWQEPAGHLLLQEYVLASLLDRLVPHFDKDQCP
jgi:hypothetical protein